MRMETLMKILIGLLGILVFSLTVSAAGALDGVWQKPCEDQNGDFVSAQVAIKSSQWTITSWGYEDQECTMKYLRFDLRFETAVSDFNMDMKIMDALYTPMTAEVAQALSEAEFCGVKSWKMGRSQSVLGLSCSSVRNYQKSQMIYSVFRKDPLPGKDLLWIGEPTKAYDGSTPEKRHVSFELYAYERGT